MAGKINVGRSKKIHHIPLSWDVNKAKSNHQPKFRPVGDAILRGREKSVGKVMEQMFAAMPPVELWIDGKLNPEQYLQRAKEISQPYIQQIAALLQVSFNEGAITQQDRIRAEANRQLKRLRSPLRLTNEDGKVTKASVGGIDVGKDPKAIWAPVGIESFDEVSSASVQYAQFRSATLVTAMIEEQQKVIQELIGESFTTAQTFSTGRSVMGLTAGQTSSALFNVLEEMNPNTPLGRQLAQMRGVNSAGLTHPWERAVFHRSEKIAQQLADKGVTGARAYNKIRDDSNKYAKKLRRSRARMISRTEIKRAQVAGQLDSMREALDSGLADPVTSGKKWITGVTDVCPICVSLGFGRAIPVDQSFPDVGDGPPAHPNCRCDVDFSHRIKEAPQAIGAGDPKFPAGTPENPIVWQFNSGFQSAPNVTTAFRPPSVPRIPTPTPSVAATPVQPNVVPSPKIPNVDEVIEEIDAVPLQSKPTPTETGTSWKDDAFYAINATVNYKAGRVGVLIEEAIDEVSQVLGSVIPPNEVKTHIKSALLKKTSDTGNNVKVLGDFSASRKIKLPKEPKRPKKLNQAVSEERGGYKGSQNIDHRRFSTARQLDRELGDDVTTFTDEVLESMEKDGDFPFANWKEAGYKSEQDFKNAVDDFYTKADKWEKDIEDIFNGIDPVTGEPFEMAVGGTLKHPRYLPEDMRDLDEIPARRDMRISEETIYEKGTPEYDSSLKSTFHHENGHNIDFMHLSSNAPRVDDLTYDVFTLRPPRTGIVPVHESSNLIPRSTQLLNVVERRIKNYSLTMEEAIISLEDKADIALMRLFQALENSEATKRIDTYVQGLAAKAKTPKAGEQAIAKAGYLKDPTERMARIFEQYIPSRVGSLADRKLLAERIAGHDGLTGELFSVGEFEEVIVPAFEKWLRAVGMIE